MNPSKVTQPPLFLAQLEVPVQADALSLTEARKFECEQAMLMLEKSSADLPKNVQKSLLDLAAAAKRLTHHQYSLVRQIMNEVESCLSRCAGLPAGEARQLTFMCLAGKWNDLKGPNPKTAAFVKEFGTLFQSDLLSARQIVSLVDIVLMYTCPQLRLVAADTTLTSHQPLELTYDDITVKVKPMGLKYFVKSAQQTTQLQPGEAVIVTNISDVTLVTPLNCDLTPGIMQLPRHIVSTTKDLEPFALVIEIGTDTQAFTVYDAGLKQKLRLKQGEAKVTYDPKQNPDA